MKTHERGDSVMRMRSWQPSYILWLIRDGKVKTREDIINYFRDRKTSILGSDGYFFEDALEKLIGANLIKLNNTGEFQVTNLLQKIQTTLEISLAKLAQAHPYNSMLVSPLFGPPLGEAYGEKYSYDLFVLMPFSAELQPIYDDHMRKVAKSMGLTMGRADDFFSTKEVIQEIWNAIALSKVLIADCTGKNPNVFYEIGVAHTVGKNVILITQKKDDIPFDLRHLRYIEYEYTPPGMKRFEGKLKKTLLELDEDMKYDEGVDMWLLHKSNAENDAKMQSKQEALRKRRKKR